jgi:hypothetical protein
MEEDKILLSEAKAEIKEKQQNFGSYAAFSNVATLDVWEFAPQRTEYDTRCRECKWFDPAYDHCYLFGATSVEDLICESFLPAE